MGFIGLYSYLFNFSIIPGIWIIIYLSKSFLCFSYISTFTINLIHVHQTYPYLMDTWDGEGTGYKVDSWGKRHNAPQTLAMQSPRGGGSEKQGVDVRGARGSTSSGTQQLHLPVWYYTTSVRYRTTGSTNAIPMEEWGWPNLRFRIFQA